MTNVGGDSQNKTTTVEDHYTDGEEFEEVLGYAEEFASSLSALRFIEETKNRWKEYGLRMAFSEAQAEWLNRLAKVGT